MKQAWLRLCGWSRSVSAVVLVQPKPSLLCPGRLHRGERAEGTWDKCWPIWRSNNLSKGLVLWKG